MENGEFREDLYYRLKVITIQLPPLRERKEDIVGLAQIFLTEFSNKTGKKVQGITRDAMKILTSHNWPGNVRELKNAMESAVVLCKDAMITQDDIITSGIRDNDGIMQEQGVAESYGKGWR